MRQNVSKPVKIAVLGASGATGRHVVASGLERGHEIVALTRRAGAIKPAAGLSEVIWPEVSDQVGLADALVGVDVVISTLGGADKGPTTVCTDAMRAAVPAMVKVGVSRVLVVSAYGVLETHDRSLYAMAVWAGVSEKMKDKESMEALITESGLDWTIVRPPALKDTPATGKYQVGEHLPIRLWHSIGRADLAAFLIREAEDPHSVRGYPRIHR